MYKTISFQRLLEKKEWDETNSPRSEVRREIIHNIFNIVRINNHTSAEFRSNNDYSTIQLNHLLAKAQTMTQIVTNHFPKYLTYHQYKLPEKYLKRVSNYTTKNIQQNNQKRHSTIAQHYVAQTTYLYRLMQESLVSVFISFKLSFKNWKYPINYLEYLKSL